MTPEVQTEAMTNEAYHANRSHDSHSSLQLFRASRERYEAIRITSTIEEEEPTPAMLFGSLFHSYCLELDTFDDRYAACPKLDKRTKDGKYQWELFQAKHAGKTHCTVDDLDKVRAMFEGIMRNRHARQLMEAEGVNESPIFWQDISGLGLKCKPDRRLSRPLAVDLKTTDDVSPDGFGRTAFNFGYHAQAALYLDGIEAETGEKFDFVFIAVSKTPPHETAVYTLDERAIDLGRATNKTTLAELAGCRLTGDFSGRWANDIHTCALPPWAFKIK